MNGAPPTSGDLERARAVLRLLFDGQTADRLAARESSMKHSLIRASIRRWTLDRLLVGLPDGHRIRPHRPSRRC